MHNENKSNEIALKLYLTYGIVKEMHLIFKVFDLTNWIYRKFPPLCIFMPVKNCC